MPSSKSWLRSFIAYPWVSFASAALAVFSTSAAWAEHPVTTMVTVIDRVQIEDLLYDYYTDIDKGVLDFTRFYAPDGVLDVNGIVSRGTEQIADLYRNSYKQAKDSGRGREHLVFFDPKIVVEGSNATADLIYTIFANKTLKGQPVLVEQGREHDDLVKKGDRWYLKSRVITSDSGLEGIFVAPYKQR